MNKKNLRYSDEFKNFCKEMYLAGRTIKDIADIMGCSSKSVSTWNIKAGINRSQSEVNIMFGVTPPSQKGRKRSQKTILKISGPNNHFWKGGISKLAKRLRMSQKAIDWRIAVFERDCYTCQICRCIGRNDQGKPLNAHHIYISVREMVNKFNTLQECFDYTPFWDLNNGITLCETCHKEVHRVTIECIKGKKVK